VDQVDRCSRHSNSHAVHCGEAVFGHFELWGGGFEYAAAVFTEHTKNHFEYPQNEPSQSFISRPRVPMALFLLDGCVLVNLVRLDELQNIDLLPEGLVTQTNYACRVSPENNHGDTHDSDQPNSY
jgi:hypothetical protein